MSIRTDASIGCQEKRVRFLGYESESQEVSPHASKRSKKVCKRDDKHHERPSKLMPIYWWLTRPRFDKSRMRMRDSLIQTASHFDITLTDMFSHLRHPMQLAHRTSMQFIKPGSTTTKGSCNARTPKLVALLAMEELCMDNDIFNKVLRFELNMGVIRPDIINRHIVFNVVPTRVHDFSLHIVFFQHPVRDWFSNGAPLANNGYHTMLPQTFSGEIQLVAHASSGTTLYFCRTCDCFKSDESRCASFDNQRSVTKMVVPWNTNPEWDSKRVDELSWESLKSRAVETFDFFSKGHTVLAKFTVEVSGQNGRFFPKLEELLD